MTHPLGPFSNGVPAWRQPSRRQFLSMLGAGAAGAGTLAAGARFLPQLLAVPGAGASSHREAPLISMDQVADNTDVYAFVSPDVADTVTLVGNWIPLQFPGGAPYYYNFGDDVLYEIHVDNNGDAMPEITYQFLFKTTIMNPDTFLYNTGPITSLDDPNWSYRQTYSVSMVDANGKSTDLGTGLRVPPYSIGPKSTPNYAPLADAAISTLSNGIKVFAGPRADPFFVDVAALFDLLTIRKPPGNAGGGANALAGANVHSIVLQIPIKQLTANSSRPTDPKDPNAIIAVWASSSRAEIQVMRDNAGNRTGAERVVQVSRLGNPLVNETIIATGFKDRFNASQPADDAQFLKFVQDPEAARLLNKLYGIKVPPAPRDDLVAVFLTGVPGATMPPHVKPSEQMRLNVAVPVTAKPNRLGVLAGDLQGYPNGRRLADDVVDISLQALAGAAYPLFHPDFKADPLATQLGDGVDGPARPYMDRFPYVALPYQGYDYSNGIAISPGASAGAPPSSGTVELNKSATGMLAGDTGGAFAGYQISSPSGSAITLSLTYNPANLANGNGIGLEVYQNGQKLGSATDSSGRGTVTVGVTPTSSGGAVLVKVFNYIPGVTINYSLVQA